MHLGATHDRVLGASPTRCRSKTFDIWPATPEAVERLEAWLDVAGIRSRDRLSKSPAYVLRH
jgi:hypothetical protein